MYENKYHRLLPLRRFINRLAFNLFIGLLLIIASLFVGVLGYHYFEGLPWIDAYVNAAMILSGMGPVSPLQTVKGKIFAGTYALFCGILFVSVIALMFLPIIHRFFHKLHLKDDQESKKEKK